MLTCSVDVGRVDVGRVDVGRVDVCDGYSVVVVSAAVDGALLWVEEGAADGPWSPCCWLAHAVATAARISHIAKALRLLHSESQTRALMALDGREPKVPVHKGPIVCRSHPRMPFLVLCLTCLMNPPPTGPLHRAVSNGALLLTSPSCNFSELECLDGP